jgi:hypothetical protein
MTSLLRYPHEIIPPQGLDPTLKDTKEDLENLRAPDEQLLYELYAKNHENQGYLSTETGLWFSNAELAQLAKETYTEAELAHLEYVLEQKGTLNVPLQYGEVMVDSVMEQVTFVAATEIDPNGPNHGDMSSMVYIRDHVQAARVLLDLYSADPETYSAEGKTCRDLLMSGLHFLSTPAQLARFDDVIQRGTQAGQEDWPHISLHFNDLEAAGPNGWRNKQDTFQMLADLTFDALDKGFLKPDDLSDAHKQYLGSIVPLLHSVGFPKYENSGSWEEIAANRTSVMMVETAMLAKMQKLTSQSDAYDFLKSGQQNFDKTLDSLVGAGLHEIGRRLPFESPDYDKSSVKYREADMALVYGSMYGIPRLLADAKIPVGPDAIVMSEREIEDMIQTEVMTLFDPLTNGIYRYEGDSYQRENYHTNQTGFIIQAIKRFVKKEAAQTGGEVDLDKKQLLRSQLTPQGRQPAWSHALYQISAEKAKRALQESDGSSIKLDEQQSTQFLNYGLSMITGVGQYYAVLGADGQYQVQPVTADRVPECEITYRYDGKIFIVPSPHTPLNWGAVELKHAIGLLRLSIARRQNKITS